MGVGDTFVVRQRFPLGDKSRFDEDTIHASLSDEVLEITIHKKPKPQARMIPIALVDTPNALVEDTKKEEIAQKSLKQEQEIVVESVFEKDGEEEEEVNKSESILEGHNAGEPSKKDQEIVVETISERDDEDGEVCKSEAVIEAQHKQQTAKETH